MTYKCDKCGYEWNARGIEAPQACPECRTRAWLRIDSSQKGDSVRSAQTSVRKSVAVRTSSAQRDSVACPGAYTICEHGKRYCAPCGTLEPAPHNPSPAEWTVAYSLIAQASKRAAGEQRAQAKG